jgi:hypothetical protein
MVKKSVFSLWESKAETLHLPPEIDCKFSVKLSKQIDTAHGVLWYMQRSGVNREPSPQLTVSV